MQKLLQKFLGTHHQRHQRRLQPVIDKVAAFEAEMKQLSDEELRAKTDKFKKHISNGLADAKLITADDAEWYELEMEERIHERERRRKVQQKIFDQILPEAFAVVREVSWRKLKMRHFDSQVMGGLILHEGMIAEMPTGEGKTLAATLPAYLNALTGRGVHIVTVNDYLARRDARWMGPIFHALGLSVSCIQGVDPGEMKRTQHSLSFMYDPEHIGDNERFVNLRPIERAEAYRADITYGQNNEFGFDYLRDNMRFSAEELCQRDHQFAIVDEVDSILIDEARTPLIISGPSEQSTELYTKLDQLVRRLDGDKDFEIDEKGKSINLTDEGITHCETLLGVENLYDESQTRIVHHINQALRAHHMFKRDVDYVVREGEIIIVDEFTGRMMPGRRWSDGLHQAIEAKEKVTVRQENQTLASVTFQNYFRMYEKLSGMTGTASTEAQEFKEIYRLEVVAIVTNKPLIRTNYSDVVFKTQKEKFLAVVQEVVELHKQGRPVLIGTISIEKSELLGQMMTDPSAMVERLTTVSQWAMNELQKHPVPDSLSELKEFLRYPSQMKQAKVAEYLEQLQEAQPKSPLLYRLEEMVLLTEVIEAIRAGLPVNVLNAKHHEKEASIVAQAGRKGAITIATNMAGRGTDILLGGNAQALADELIRHEETQRQEALAEDELEKIKAKFDAQCSAEHDEVVKVQGLHVIGTERHEARRIDNQLRGRAGRQGDPGSSRFFLSLEDDLMRIFGGERVSAIMEMKLFGWEEGLPIESGLVTRSIESAQKQVEGQHFEVRKNLLEYDNTMNRQREVIYEQRRRILDGINLEGLMRQTIGDVVEDMVAAYAPRESRVEAWDFEGMAKVAQQQFAVEVDVDALHPPQEDLIAELIDIFEKAYEAKRNTLTPEIMAQLERRVLIQTLDMKWKDHLYMMDALKEGIGLRAYGQRNPVVEYQKEAYRMFQDLVESVKTESLMLLMRIRPVAEPQPIASVFANTPQQESHPSAQGQPSVAFTPDAPQPSGQKPEQPRQPSPDLQRMRAMGVMPGGAKARPQVSQEKKVGRNEPCPCGSGKKYKKCCGA